MRASAMGKEITIDHNETKTAPRRNDDMESDYDDARGQQRRGTAAAAAPALPIERVDASVWASLEGRLR